MKTKIELQDKFANWLVSNIVGGQFGYTIVTQTVPKMRKNPLVGRVTKLTLTSQALLGAGYENQVTKRGGENFHAEKPKGMTWVVPNLLLRSDKDETKYYLRVSYRKSTRVSSIYLIDGIKATPKQVAEIKTYLPTPSVSQKQLEAGVSDEVIVRSYALENILLVHQNDEHSYNTTNLPIRLLKELFD